MRLHSGMTRESIREALESAVFSTWGVERLEADRDVIDNAARHIWSVLKVPLTPMCEEPDLPIRPQDESER